MIEVTENFFLSPLTTFKIGGQARHFVEVDSAGEIREAILWARGKRLPYFILAGGSNILFPDDGMDALVIKIASRKAEFTGNRLSADAGCSLLDLIKQSSMLSLGGWESMAGIPGTVGGAVRGNAGAFGTEIKDVLFSVSAMHAMTFETREFSALECDFSYRHSFFKDNPEWIIIRVTLELKKVEPGNSIAQIDQTIIEREKRHLQNVQAAGSYFTNPVAPPEIETMFETEKNTQSREHRVPAGWLIEKAGMKGAKVGGAIASLQHPNYLVNTGNATAKDVQELAAKVKKAVFDRFGIQLVEEAVIIAK